MTPTDPGRTAYEARFADARPREFDPWDSLTPEVKAIWARVEVEVREQCARLVETFPEQILAWHSRGPNGPPGNALRATTWADLALAIRGIGEASKQAASTAWPAGCIKPGSCSRHRQCMYAGSVEQCRHFGRSLKADFEAALAAKAAPLPETDTGGKS